jgi:hypothetical protein
MFHPRKREDFGNINFEVYIKTNLILDRISLATYLFYKKYKLTNTNKTHAAESRILTAQLLSNLTRILWNLNVITVYTKARHLSLSSTR